MTRRPSDLTVLLHDEEYREFVRGSHDFEVVYKPGTSRRMKTIAARKNLFILSKASLLPEIADLVRIAIQMHTLRVLFVHDDIDTKLLPQMFGRAKLRSYRNTLVHSDHTLPQRVLNAWQMGAQNELIATASVLCDKLFVVSCALNAFELPLDKIPRLKDLTDEKRQKFKMDEDGGFLYWPDTDFHLNINSLRYLLDSKWREKTDILKFAENEKFGTAVAHMRKMRGLRQGDISGLSSRQVSRIEHGASPTVKSLRLLAKAHRYSLKEYLKKVADLAS